MICASFHQQRYLALRADTDANRMFLRRYMITAVFVKVSHHWRKCYIKRFISNPNCSLTTYLSGVANRTLQFSLMRSFEVIRFIFTRLLRWKFLIFAAQCFSLILGYPYVKVSMVYGFFAFITAYKGTLCPFALLLPSGGCFYTGCQCSSCKQDEYFSL